MLAFHIAKKFTELAAPEINLALTSTFKKLLAPIRKQLPDGLDVFIGYWDKIPQQLQEKYRSVRSSGLPTDELYNARDVSQTFHSFFYNKIIKKDVPEVVAMGRGIPLNPMCRTMYKEADNHIGFKVETTKPEVFFLSVGSWGFDFTQYKNSLIHAQPSANEMYPPSLLTLIQKEPFFEAGGVYVADGFRGHDLGSIMGTTLRTVISNALDSSTFAGVNKAFWPGSTRATLATYKNAITTFETPARKGTDVRIIMGLKDKSLYDFLMQSSHFQDLNQFAKNNNYLKT